MFKNFSARFVLNLIHQLAMILLIVIMGNRLNVDSFGLVAIGLIIFQISYSISEWGFSLESIKRINYKVENLNKLISDITFSKVVIFLINFIIILIINSISFNFDFEYLFSLNILILFASFNNLWFFQAINKTEYLIFSTFLGRLVGLLIVFIFLDSYNIYIVFLSQAISFGLPIIFGYLYMFKKYNLQINFSFSSSLKVIYESMHYFFSYLSQNYIHTMWGIPILLNSNPAIIGFYHLCDQLIRSGNAINTLIPEVLLSTFKNFDDRKKIIRSILLILFPAFILLWFLISPLIDFIFDAKFNDAILYIKISLLSLFCMTLIKLFGFPMLGYFYSDNYVSSLIIKFGAINILLVFSSIIYNIDQLFMVSTIFFILNLLFLIYICLRVYFHKD